MKSLREIVVLIAASILFIAVAASKVQTFEVNTTAHESIEINSDVLTRSIVDQIFPGSKYTIQAGLVNFSSQINANYLTLYLEQIRYGRFIDSDDEYLVILRAPKEVTCHAGGFYYAIGAVFDGKTNEIKSPVQQFMSDEGEISILEGKERHQVLFLGSVMYQGWGEAQGKLYDLSSGQWEEVWPRQGAFWKDRYAIFGNNRLVLYKRVIEHHNQESVIPPNHFELDTELIWDQYAETFREPEKWE